jgi:ech hydrogenase subunit D
MDVGAFLDRVAAYARDGWRLVVINATSLLPAEGAEDGAFDITWSFARERVFEHLREQVLPGDEVPSISAQFPASFLYENELRELFGIEVTGIAVDFGGQMYRTGERVPFAPGAIRARLEASGRLDTTARPDAAARPERGEQQP